MTGEETITEVEGNKSTNYSKTNIYHNDHMSNKWC
jgi:hypothetical protein